MDEENKIPNPQVEGQPVLPADEEKKPEGEVPETPEAPAA